MLTKHKYLLSTSVQLQIQGIPPMISFPKLYRREVEELRGGSKSLKHSNSWLIRAYCSSRIGSEAAGLFCLSNECWLMGVEHDGGGSRRCPNSICPASLSWKAKPHEAEGSWPKVRAAGAWGQSVHIILMAGSQKRQRTASRWLQLRVWMPSHPFLSLQKFQQPLSGSTRVAYGPCWGHQSPGPVTY